MACRGPWRGCIFSDLFNYRPLSWYYNVHGRSCSWPLCPRFNVGAFKKVNESYGWLGSIGLIAGFMILSFYSVVGGWVIYYIFRAIIGFYMTDPAQTEQLFTGFISNPILPILFHALFMAMTIGICYNGVQDGIEKYSNIMMPALLVIVIILSVHSLMLPGAAEGIKFYLVPDFSKSYWRNVLSSSGSSIFLFELRNGFYTNIWQLFGKKRKYTQCLFDSSLNGHHDCLLAGIIIFPAVFSYGFKPTSGPGLTFVDSSSSIQRDALRSAFWRSFFLLAVSCCFNFRYFLTRTSYRLYDRRT